MKKKKGSDAGKKKGVPHIRREKKSNGPAAKGRPRAMTSGKKVKIVSPESRETVGAAAQESLTGVAKPAENLVPAKPLEPPPPVVEVISNNLPFSYNETKLILLVRDPHWAFCYWDFSAETWNGIQQRMQAEAGMRALLRVHNLDARTCADVEVELKSRNWHVHLGQPDALYEAEVGLLDQAGKFHVIARSNRMRTPRNKPSEMTDQNWEIEKYEEVYRLSGGGKTGEGSEGFSRIKKF